MKIIRAISLFAGAATLFACSSAEQDWKTADAANTVPGFQNFLAQHPNDAHAPQAREGIQKLEDTQAWADARTGNSLAGYQQYLQKEPSGAYVDEAHKRLSSLAREAAWKRAQAANSESALQDFLHKYSEGPEADQARAQLEKLTGYRVQLATSRNETAADKSRGSLQTRFNGELHAVVVIPPSGTDKLYRVDSEPMTETDAKSACTKLKKEHQHCAVVKS